MVTNRFINKKIKYIYIFIKGIIRSSMNYEYIKLNSLKYENVRVIESLNIYL